MNSSEYDTILWQKLEEELKKRITRGEVMDHTLWEAMEYSPLFFFELQGFNDVLGLLYRTEEEKTRGMSYG